MDPKKEGFEELLGKIVKLGAVFRYERCPELCHPKNAIDLIEGAWLACAPLVDLLRK